MIKAEWTNADALDSHQLVTDCINRWVTIEALCSVCGADCDKSEFVYDGKQEEQAIFCPEHYVLTQLPSAWSERPKGHWIDTGSGQECSECGEIQYGYDNFRYYCAKCGSDNRGEQG